MRHPNKMYISFKSSGVDSKFFINASYSSTLTGANFANSFKCSDKGANLGNANEGGSTGNNNGGGSVPNPSGTPQVNVLTKKQRE